MKQVSLTFLLFCAFATFAADDDDTYKVHVYGLSYSRVRKTVTSSNRVTADFQVKNVSSAVVSDVTVSLLYTAGLGETIGEPLKRKLGNLKPGEVQKVSLVGDFIPAFSGYTMTVEYNPKQKEEWLSTSDTGQPQPKNSELLKGTASVVLLGKEAAPDRSGRFAGTVKVKNEGTIEAKGVKITVTFFDAKKQKMGEWSDKLGNGTLGGGLEENFSFVCARTPRGYTGYELKVGCEEVAAETALSGGEFSNAEEVEFARFAFKRRDPKSPDLEVKAEVRNGLSDPANQVKLTLTFLGAKKKQVKQFTYEVPGQLKPGETKPVSFTVPALPAYEAFEQAVAYNKAGAGEKPATAAKIEAPKFKNTSDVEVIFTDAVSNDDKSVSLSGAMRNGKSVPVKDVAISVQFTKSDGKPLVTGEKTITDVIQPGEERNFVLKAPGAAGFASYGFKFKYAEAGQ